MALLVFFVFGIVVGLIARAIMPGNQSMGLLATGLVGVVGSFVGGFLGSLLGGDSILAFHTSGIFGSIVGSLIVLALLGYSGRRRSFV
ncbi:GlsB/YeaQ/YmgE family stress response membrane protein [Labilithrix luteola]|uniref:GlsB/YeaQ/YmgE family stress response membrane protein n=1 Tax=Labilithrix luteola TaxID=1391654 RepID=UPI0011BAD53F